jgi:hypothetical protein
MILARSISDTPGSVVVKDTKSHAARRMALDPMTVAVLRGHRETVDKRTEAAGVTVPPAGFIWSQSVDASEPYRPIRVSGTFRGVRDKLGLTNVTFTSPPPPSPAEVSASGPLPADSAMPTQT